MLAPATNAVLNEYRKKGFSANVFLKLSVSLYNRANSKFNGLNTH